jgi:hypothetical protein
VSDCFRALTLENRGMAKTLVSNSSAPTHDEIAAHAYEIYIREGSVAGRDLDHWLQAEAELRNGNGNGNGSHLTTQAPTGQVDTAKTIASSPTASVAAARPAAPKRTAKR